MTQFMKLLSREEWKDRAEKHLEFVSAAADAYLLRRSLHDKHPVYDFLFTYYTFSPKKLKQWVPSFDEALNVNPGEKLPCFDPHWFERSEKIIRHDMQRLHGRTLSLVSFIAELSNAITARPPRFGCYGLHEWAMVYRLSPEEIRHADYPLRLPQEELAQFVESQNLCCTHYDAYRFFTPLAKPFNLFQPDLSTRIQKEQAGCLHANMDIYKWATKLWPWIGSDFIAKAFLLAMEGRELDMRASPYDLQKHGYAPICIETEAGRREYQSLQQQYALKSQPLRQELATLCERLIIAKNR